MSLSQVESHAHFTMTRRPRILELRSDSQRLSKAQAEIQRASKGSREVKVSKG